MKNVNVFVFIVAPVQAYLLFSNFIKLSFRPRHFLIHESFTTGEVSLEYNAEELGYVLTLLAILEESGTGIRHEVGLAALGIGSNNIEQRAVIQECHCHFAYIVVAACKKRCCCGEG